MDKSKVVVIKKFSTAGEAMIYQTLLASNGIECELINETAFDIMSGWKSSWSWLKRTKKLLKQFLQPNSINKSLKLKVSKDAKNHDFYHTLQQETVAMIATVSV